MPQHSSCGEHRQFPERVVPKVVKIRGASPRVGVSTRRSRGLVRNRPFAAHGGEPVGCPSAGVVHIPWHAAGIGIDDALEARGALGEREQLVDLFLVPANTSWLRRS